MSSSIASRPTPAASPVILASGPAQIWTTILLTARSYIARSWTYLIDIVRWPLFPLIFYGVISLTYRVAGQTTIAGIDTQSFLLLGMFAFVTWSGTIWSSGYAIEYERSEGTIAALFLSPVNRAAVVAGYGLGGFVWMAPTFVVISLLGWATGAHLLITDPLAAIVSLLCFFLSALATGFALAGLFILSRRANLMANFLQRPGELLSGALFPRENLPRPLYLLSDCLPVSHALDALRATLLRGATLQATLTPLLLTVGLALLYAVAGIIALRKVEYATKRAGELDLY